MFNIHTFVPVEPRKLKHRMYKSAMDSLREMAYAEDMERTLVQQSTYSALLNNSILQDIDRYILSGGYHKLEMILASPLPLTTIREEVMKAIDKYLDECHNLYMCKMYYDTIQKKLSITLRT